MKEWGYPVYPLSNNIVPNTWLAHTTRYCLVHPPRCLYLFENSNTSFQAPKGDILFKVYLWPLPQCLVVVVIHLGNIYWKSTWQYLACKILSFLYMVVKREVEHSKFKRGQKWRTVVFSYCHIHQECTKCFIKSFI